MTALVLNREEHPTLTGTFQTSHGRARQTDPVGSHSWEKLTLASEDCSPRATIGA